MDNIGVGVIVGLVVASCLFIYNNESFTNSQKTVLLILLVFPPAQWLGIIIVLIYNSIQADNSTEKVSERKVEEDKTKIDTTINDLNDLKEKGILTETEYKEKVAKIKKEQTQQNIENSLEYKQLKGLLNSGILTKEEFESKVKLLTSIIDEEKIIRKVNKIKYDVIIWHKDTYFDNVIGQYKVLQVESSNLSIDGFTFFKKFETEHYFIKDKNNHYFNSAEELIFNQKQIEIKIKQ